LQTKKFSSYTRILKIILLLTLVTYLIVSGKLDLQKLSFLIKKENLLTLLFIIFLILISYISFAVRQKIFVNSLGGNLQTFFSFKIVLIAYFLNNFLIGAIGIDLVRIYYIKAHTKIRYSELGSFILIDRLLGIGSLVFISFLTLLVFSFHGASEYSFLVNFGLIQYLWYIALLPAILLGLILLLRFEKIYTLCSKIFQRLIFGKQIQNFFYGLKKLTDQWKTFFIIIGLYLIGHFSTISGISLLALHLYGKESMVASFLLSPFIFLAGVIPVTPGNIGWTETVADIIWSIIGVRGGATVFAIWRVIILILSLIGGLFYVRMGKNYSEARKRQPCAE